MKKKKKGNSLKSKIIAQSVDSSGGISTNSDVSSTIATNGKIMSSASSGGGAKKPPTLVTRAGDIDSYVQKH